MRFNIEVTYATPGSAGFDIAAAETTLVPPGEVRIIPTGLFLVEPLEGDSETRGAEELQIRSRSGTVAKRKLVVLNSPGTIDIDYRDEIKIILMNVGKTEQVVLKGERIAQGVIGLTLKPDSPYTFKLGKRTGGIGSTGA